VKLHLCLLFAVVLGAQSLDEGMRLFKEQNFPAAARELDRFVKSNPKNRTARYVLALSWQQTGELAKAQQHLIEIIRNEPKWGPAHYALARVYFFAGRFDDAIQSAKIALRLGEPAPRVHHLIGSIEEERGRLDAALAAFTAGGAESGRASALYKLGRYAEAQKAVESALRSDPKNPEALRVARQLTRAATPATAKAADPVRFERIPFPFRLEHNPTPEKHLVSTMAGGLAAFDYDNDGLLDLYFTNGAELPGFAKSNPKFHNRLYRNLGNWKFEDVTATAGLAGEGFSIGAAAGDFDGDGWTDLFVAGASRNLLYRNDKGRFVPVENAIANEKWSVGGAWIDYDKDGKLDLFVVNYLDWTPESPKFCGDPARNLRVYCHPKEYRGTANRLYRNLGGGKFADVSQPSGIAKHIGKGMSAAIADYDSDGHPDIFVTNDSEPNFLFRNLGDGRFEEVALTAGVALNDQGKPVSSMGVSFQDYDNDGRPDVLITALTGETFPLFRNSDGVFVDFTYPSRSGISTARRSGWGVALADLNNDGWKDIVTANSHVTDNIDQLRSETYREPNLILLNSGGRFGEPIEFGPAAPHRGLVVADLDNDGRLDIVVTVLGGEAEVWRNVTPNTGNWIGVAAPAGAKVRVAGQVQEAHTATGYNSSVAAPLHFGIGTQQSADVEVTLPNGERRELKAAPAGKVVRIQ